MTQGKAVTSPSFFSKAYGVPLLQTNVIVYNTSNPAGVPSLPSSCFSWILNFCSLCTGFWKPCSRRSELFLTQWAASCQGRSSPASLTDAAAAINASCLQMPGDLSAGQAEMCLVAQDWGKWGKEIQTQRVCHDWKVSEEVGWGLRSFRACYSHGGRGGFLARYNSESRKVCVGLAVHNYPRRTPSSAFPLLLPCWYC